MLRHRMHRRESRPNENGSDVIIDKGGFYDVQVQMVALSVSLTRRLNQHNFHCLSILSLSSIVGYSWQHSGFGGMV